MAVGLETFTLAIVFDLDTSHKVIKPLGCLTCKRYIYGKLVRVAVRFVMTRDVAFDADVPTDIVGGRGLKSIVASPLAEKSLKVSAYR
jgi:hypothetical protein